MLQRMFLRTPNAQRRGIAARAIVQGSATTLIYGGAHAMRPFALTAASFLLASRISALRRYDNRIPTTR